MDFTEIYRTQFAGVYCYALALCGNASLAEEITQETFFRSLTAIEKFRGDCALRTWLCRIARNCFMDHCRDRCRLAPEGGGTETTAHSPEEELLCREQADAALAELERLPEPYREVLRLRAFGTLSFRKIAEIYGKTENWARVTCFRARQRLKEEME